MRTVPTRPQLSTGGDRTLAKKKVIEAIVRRGAAVLQPAMSSALIRWFPREKFFGNNLMACVLLVRATSRANANSLQFCVSIDRVLLLVVLNRGLRMRLPILSSRRTNCSSKLRSFEVIARLSFCHKSNLPRTRLLPHWQSTEVRDG